MVIGMRTGYPRGLNKGLASKFHDGSRLREGSRVRQEIPEECRSTHRPKRCTDNNEDEDNSPNNPNNTSLGKDMNLAILPPAMGKQ